MLLTALLACKKLEFDLDVDLMPGGGTPTEVPTTSPFELALFDERPTAELPAFLDLEGFGPALLADRVRREVDDGFVTVAVSDVTFDVDAPLELSFAVSSTDGRYHVLGDEPGGEVPECTFTVDVDTTEADAADRLLSCLRAATEANGGPNDFAVSVVAATDDDDWEYRATYTLGTDRPVDVTCSGALGLGDELREQAGSAEIVVEDLSLAGYAAAQDEGASVVAFAAVWATDAEPAATGAWGTARVEAGEGRFVGAELEVGPEVPPSVRFSGGAEPVTAWPATWAETAMDVLLADGFVESCDVRVHDARPNESWVELALLGTGEAVRE